MTFKTWSFAQANHSTTPASTPPQNLTLSSDPILPIAPADPPPLTGFVLLPAAPSFQDLLPVDPPVHINGTEMGETLIGNGYNNRILGWGGDDIISGRGGNDWLDGGTGNDSLRGGDGEDELFGWLGHDYLLGGEGNDVLHGEDGDDGLEGDRGNDLLYGGEGNDDLLGGENNDVLHGEDGNDDLEGDYGDDLLYGGRGADDLYGRVGNDVLQGYGFSDGEIDDLTGGGGVDTFVLGDGQRCFYMGEGHAVIEDFASSFHGDILLLNGYSQYEIRYRYHEGSVGDFFKDGELYSNGDLIALFPYMEVNAYLGLGNFRYVYSGFDQG
ncbi:hypothetical protein H6G89_22880 [Oscillatoria sp. FACHB-1407]|uniref:calcium-binding protein n=1 Tax=Oscillatoria sp. FACHB-1407 TaxID=2692847 RepID=UPI0016861F31|nr:calcium-binding protein [Oscillatoria sp. FACHB-1407]MBD2463850.1 hypothetical protein [Oscillatoria sp. FACHB-1407]